MRFYFDHSETPQIEGRIDDLIAYNEHVGEPLSKRVSAFLEDGGIFAGNNLYFPLPFAKHCKVTYQQATEEVEDVLYYQINYRKYQAGTRVKTYQKDDSPFIAQPIGDGNRSPGISVNSRWRILDVIPFERSLKFDIELWHWGNTRMDYAPTTFWYGTKEAKAEVMGNMEAVQLSVKHSDKFEGESLEVKEVTGGETLTQAFLSYEWSARNHLYWKGIKKEDTLKTVFYSEKDRKGKLDAVFTHAPEYITVDMYLNGQRIFENLDLYSDSLNLKKYTVDNGFIKKGNNTVLMIAKGANKQNPKADQLGFDYLKISE